MAGLDDCVRVSVWVAGGGGDVQERRDSTVSAAALGRPWDGRSLLTKAPEEFAAFVLPPSQTGWVNQESTNMWKTF